LHLTWQRFRAIHREVRIQTSHRITLICCRALPASKVRLPIPPPHHLGIAKPSTNSYTVLCTIRYLQPRITALSRQSVPFKKYQNSTSPVSSFFSVSPLSASFTATAVLPSQDPTISSTFFPAIASSSDTMICGTLV